jgi:hypothetical protein
VFPNEGNRFAKVRQTFLTRFALAIGAGHFGAIGDVPRAVLLDNRCKLIVHASILPPKALNVCDHALQHILLGLASEGRRLGLVSTFLKRFRSW